MTRREFLGAATVLAAGAAASECLVGGAEPTPSAKRRLRLGFLGASHSHALEKLAAAQRAVDYELIGVCEDSKPVQEKVRQQGVPLITLQELLEKAEVVAVESGVDRHAADALVALAAGKHVHLEKPPAAKPGELEQIFAAAKPKNLRVQVGYMWRYNPGFLAVFEAARNGWLGEIFMVRGALSNFLAPERRPDWGAFKGGSLFDLGSHLVDVVVRLSGEPKKITSFLRRDGQPADDLRDNNLVVFEYDRGLAVVTNNALQKTKSGQRAFEVLGTRGSAVVQPFEPPALEIELVEAAGPYRKGIQKVPLPEYHRYEADLAELAAAVRGERPLSVQPDVELQVQNALLRACLMG